MTKLIKYRLLRHFPGPLGYRYKCKYAVKTNGFEDAVRRCKGMISVDLGANLGVYTRKMASEAKLVIAFEPDPWVLPQLRANLADLDNVKIEDAAAGTTEDAVCLYRHCRFEENPKSHSESSSVVASKRNVSGKAAVTVRQIDFISYLEDLNENIGVLKIDIEGSEVDLLETLFERPDLLGRIDCIFAETHERHIPGHKARVKILRARARSLTRPYVNLYWR